MKYHWIDYSHVLSLQQIRFTYPSHKNVDYEWNHGTGIKELISENSSIVFSFRDQKKDTERTYFSSLGSKSFKPTSFCENY